MKEDDKVEPDIVSTISGDGFEDVSPSVDKWKMLQVLFDRFVRNASLYFVSNVSHDALLGGCDMDICKFSECKEKYMQSNSILNIFDCDGLDGKGLISCSRDLFFYVLESMLGSNQANQRQERANVPLLKKRWHNICTKYHV